MAYQAGKSVKRSKPSYIYSTVSITMVLFMLGMLGVLYIFSNKISTYLRENIEVSVILKDNLNEVDVFQFQKLLDKHPFIKTSEYISKDKAAEILKEEFGEDLEILGYNPLYASINVHLHAPYANPDSLAKMEAELTEYQQVQEVYYFGSLVGTVNKNLKNIGLILGIVAIVLLIIALTLIDSTIKLSMYSSRFLIKSMQLVGATRWFIIKPFVIRSIFNGLISGLVAVIVIIGLLYYVQRKLPDLVLIDDISSFAFIFMLVVGGGVLISWASTTLAVSKYLKLRLDDLY